jgi:hypothetical protein
MSDTLPDGKPRPPLPPMIELPGHNGILMRFSDDDPYAVVDTTERPCDIMPQIREFEARREALSEELRDFQRAMEQIKRERQRNFLTWKEVLEAIHDLGYRRVAQSTIELDPQPKAQS